jgi:hypothetical protein|tara:strand:+ start:112 stop:330 length:219 start_codon:yes stop_codon:yes gene_type:complete
MNTTIKQLNIADDLEFQTLINKEPLLTEMLQCEDKKKFKQMTNVIAVRHGREWCQYAWDYLMLSIKDNEENK